MTIQELVNKYHYKPLNKELSSSQRQQYLQELPPIFSINGDLNCKVYDKFYNFISYGYSRIVIGDYGAFVEIPLDKMELNNLRIAPGQEYRFLPEYKNVKYHWYCLYKNTNIKIYF